jgi:hypothetical protein
MKMFQCDITKRVLPANAGHTIKLSIDGHEISADIAKDLLPEATTLIQLALSPGPRSHLVWNDIVSCCMAQPLQLEETDTVQAKIELLKALEVLEKNEKVQETINSVCRSKSFAEGGP